MPSTQEEVCIYGVLGVCFPKIPALYEAIVSNPGSSGVRY